MITACQYLGIYVDTIESAVKECEDAMEKLGFSIYEIDDMNEDAKNELEEVGEMSNITNSIISAYYHATEYAIHKKYPNLRIDYYVNRSDSSIDVEELQEMAEDEIREDWGKALSSLPYDKIAAKIEWGFSDADLQELMELHRQNKHREKIEDLLDDCNFHYESGEWHDGNYVIRED